MELGITVSGSSQTELNRKRLHYPRARGMTTIRILLLILLLHIIKKMMSVLFILLLIYSYFPKELQENTHENKKKRLILFELILFNRGLFSRCYCPVVYVSVVVFLFFECS